MWRKILVATRAMMSADEDSGWLREARHNPCLMNPLSAIMIFILFGVSAITMLLHIPAFLLGLLVSPIARRTAWFIEFLYPTGLARWGHFFLINSASKSRKQKKESGDSHGHSRSIEQRFEVIKGRVYIHSIPNLMDNLAYLVVCCPPPSSDTKTIVAFLVDCGDADAVLTQMDDIHEVHYPQHTIQLKSILCTHKHHDHTAGNLPLLSSGRVDIEQIVGGAVERVPYCNTPIANRDMVVLPSVDGNDMNDVLEVEVLAVPAHTRGSVVYAMRTKEYGEDESAYLFVGDTMFSGGGGVPFEADIETPSDERVSDKTGASYVKPSAGSKAVERCFSEILFRGLGSKVDAFGSDISSHMLVFPGHEYTSELINRQFRSSSETSQWTKLPPSVFFETASQLYIASHRRAIPHSGRLLTVPTLITRELYINPHFRSMKKRGEHLIRAVRVWYRHFAKDYIDEGLNNDSMISNASTYVPKLNDSNKTPSTDTQWNLTPDDIARPIFTTVFSADLEAIIDDLASDRISPQKAANRLRSMQSNLEDPVIHRRPIPGTLPSEKNAYLGVLALAILGSGPCAMTLSDSHAMNLPAPMDAKSDRIRISKKRLLAVLSGLGLLTAANDGSHVVQMIELLWKDACEYEIRSDDATEHAENGTGTKDEIELGVIKWALYGAEANQPSWFSKFCMPCGDKPPVQEMRDHPVLALANVRRSGGELVRHDVPHCPLCRDATGCPLVEPLGEPTESKSIDDSSPPRLSESISVEVALPTRIQRELSSREKSIPFDEKDDEEDSSDGSNGNLAIKPLLTEA